jgi:hypothetical protein
MGKLYDKMLAAQIAIDNAVLDEEVKTLMAVYGYDDARLTAGKDLLDTANLLQ